MTDDLFKGLTRETAEGGQYFVGYDEDLFLSFDDEQREVCYQAWEKKAIPLHCTMLVVQLIPDPFFPVHGHDKPYVYMKRDIANAPGVPDFTVTTICVVTINMDKFAKQTELERAQVRTKARHAAINGGCDRWHLNNGGTRVEEGKRS
jgi:hypothetical protein